MANQFSPESLGIQAPPGGFQEGGWYKGRQFKGGTLSDPGVIHPGSAQIGAGRAVSTEVIAQTDPANVAFIAEERRKAQAQPTAPVAPPAQLPGVQPGQPGAPAITPQPTLNLPELSESLFAESGVREIETQLSGMERSFIEAKGKVNDNPFLSEATRVGRIAKLETLFQERTANIRGDIATKKADIETKLNLELKQFDINSQQARDALDQFNTLLNIGALSGASGEDIAQLTRSTGISSTMIRSAIKASTAKDANTKLITSTDNQGIVTATLIDLDTGRTINQTSLGTVGKAKETDGSQKIDEQEVKFSLIEDVRTGKGVREIFAIYSGLLEANAIIELYNANSPHGTAVESEAELKKLGVKF